MSIPESLSKKLPIVNTSIMMLGVIGSLLVGAYNYLHKNDSNNENSIKNYETLNKGMEVLTKRVDNHDIVIGGQGRDIGDLKTAQAVANANYENLNKKADRIENGLDIQISIQREILDKLNKHR